MYEDRIEHWASTWKTNDLKQCSLCCFWGSTTDMGYTDDIDDEKVSEEHVYKKCKMSIYDNETKCETKSETKSEAQSKPLCDHGASFCRDCLKQYFTLEMKEAPGIKLPLTGITCPYKCCTPVLDSVVQKLLGEEKFRPLALKMRTRRIMARPNLRFCPNDGCGMEISVVGTKLRVLSSTPVARSSSWGSDSSSSLTHRWYSVSVRELIPGNKITRTPDTYRIEYESVTKPDEVIELIHLPLFSKDITSLDTLPKLSQNKTDDSGTVIPTPKTYYYFENEDDSVLPAVGAKFLPGEIVSEMKTGYTTSAYGTNKPTCYQIENVFQSPGKHTTKSEALYVVKQLNKKSTDPKMILKQEKDLQTNAVAFKKKDGAVIDTEKGGWIQMLQCENKQMFNNFHNRRSDVDRSPGTEVNGRAVIDTSCSNDCWKCQFSICNKCGQAAHHGTTCNANADDALLALSKDREKFVQCPKCCGVLSRIAGCDHMTCSTAGQGCSAEFCFECLSMPHCGTSCKKPEKAKQLRMEWKKERDEREHQNMYGSETKEDIKEDTKEENLEETIFIA
mgnify:CR=1 FL=1